MASPVKEHVSVNADANDEKPKFKRNVDSKILNAFWKLVDVNANNRLTAAEKILVIVKRKQEAHDEPTTMCPDLSYCLERLVKGLGSSRMAAREGFTVVLTEILKHEVVAVDSFFQLVEKHLPLHGNQMDMAPAVIGQSLAYGALIRSGRLVSNSEALKTTIAALQKLSSRRVYIEQVCSALLLELCAQLSEKQFEKLAWPQIKEELSCGWSQCTPDVLFLLLATSRLFPSIVDSKFLSTYWKAETIIHESCFEELGKVLKKSTSVNPLVHCVCNELISAVLKGKCFERFWSKVIDEMLLQSGQNEKVYLGFQLIKKVLPQLTSEKSVAAVLSPTFHRIFTKTVFNNQHSLNSLAKEMADTLEQFVKECTNSGSQFKVLQIFISPPGSIFFDHITKKKTLSSVVSSLQEESVLQYAELMKQTILDSKSEKTNDDENDDDGEDPQRTYAVHQLASVIKHPAVLTKSDWQKDIVCFLLVHAFFDIKKECDLPQCSVKPAPMSASLRRTCQEAFYKALEGYSSLKSPANAKTRLQGEAEALNEITDVATSLLQAKKLVSPIVSLEEIIERWDKTLLIVKRLKKLAQKGAKGEEANAFQVLFLFLNLQLLSDPEYPIGPLEELEECCKNALNIKISSKSSSEEVEEAQNEELLWSEVLVDLMLSLLPNANHVMRSSLALVFSFIIPHVTEKSLQQILDAINPEAVTEGEEGPLVEEDEDEEAMEVEEKEDAEDKESSSSSSEESSDTEDEESVDEELKEKVKSALGDAAEDSENDSETYMSDSEMMKLDDALAEAFRQHAKANQKVTKHEKSLQTFRLRCLDFVMIFLKSNRSLPRMIQTIKPLLATAEFGVRQDAREPLKTKAISALELLLKCKKFDNTEDDNTKDVLLELLAFLIDKMKKTSNLDLMKILSRLCAWTVVVGNKFFNGPAEDNETESGRWYLPLYNQALKDHFTKGKAGTHQFLFHSLLDACPEASIHFIRWLQEHIFSEKIRHFKKVEGLELLSKALTAFKGVKTVGQDDWTSILNYYLPHLSQIVADELAKKKDAARRLICDCLELLYLFGSISESAFSMYPLKECPKLSDTLKNLPRSKKRLFMRRMKSTPKKLLRLIQGSKENESS